MTSSRGKAPTRAVIANGKGSLTVVGCGIKAVTDITIGAQAAIAQADMVFYLTSNPLSSHVVQQLNLNSVSLQDCYREGAPRIEAYNAMIERILEQVRLGFDVCCIFYGHPGIFVYPSHKAMKIAASEGFPAVMMPGISAEDSLFADLGLDPAMTGLMSFEATDYLLRKRPADKSCALLLWQVGVIGHSDFQGAGYPNKGFSLLREILQGTYGRQHEVVLYEAAQLAGLQPRIQPVRLDELKDSDARAHTTMYVPPCAEREFDDEMVRKLKAVSGAPEEAQPIIIKA